MMGPLTSEQTLISELQQMNARLLAMLAERPAPDEPLPGLANEYAENMELVHIYRTHGLDVWRAEHRRVMAERKIRMARRLS